VSEVPIGPIGLVESRGNGYIVSDTFLREG